MSIGKRIKIVREKKGLSQVAFATMLGISHGALQSYEKDSSVPGGKALTALLRLGVDINWLLGKEHAALKKTPGGAYLAGEGVADSWDNDTPQSMDLVAGDSVDTQLLTQSLQVVEDFLKDNAYAASTTAKVKMVVLVYEIIGQGGTMTASILKKIASMAMGLNL